MAVSVVAVVALALFLVRGSNTPMAARYCMTVRLVASRVGLRA